MTSPTHAASQARRLATQDKLQRIRQALQRLRREQAQVTYPAVAQRAGVSRTFLYQNADAQALMADAITTHASAGGNSRPAPTPRPRPPGGSMPSTPRTR